MDASTRKNLLSAALVIGLLAVTAWTILHCAADVRRMLQLHNTHNELRWIVRALNHYHETYKSYPPASVRNHRDEAIHSWRALVQPHLAQTVSTRDNFFTYQFAEEWDSPANKRSAQDHRFGNHPFQILAVVGPDAAWDPNRPRTGEQISESPSDSFFLVALRKTGVRWHEPADAIMGETGELSVKGRTINPGTELFVVLASGEIDYFEHGIPDDERSRRFTSHGRDNAGEEITERW